MNTRRTYSELLEIPTFEERFQYLKIDGVVGKETFGYDRYLNQILYTSQRWRSFRREMAIRDSDGNIIFDLACPDREAVRPTLHHINPITIEDVLNRNPCVFDPENVVFAGHMTHKGIHFSTEDLLVKDPIERKPNDTCPWR